MPKGLIIMNWHIRIGVNILQRLPSDLEVNEKALMQIFIQHEFSDQAGYVSLRSGNDHMVSYYFGPKLGIYCILVLLDNEDTDLYGRVINDVALDILASIKNDLLEEKIAEIYNQIKEYSDFNKEQQLGLMYINKIKRYILDKLGNEGLILKDEIIAWFKSQEDGDYIDVEELILGLVDEGLLHMDYKEDIDSKVYYLNQKLVVSRDLPSEILKKSKEIPFQNKDHEKYIQEVTDYFDKYSSATEDNLELINNTILKKKVYYILTILREKPLSEDDIHKIEVSKGEKFTPILQELEDNHLIYTFYDENKMKYYVLKTDFRIYKKS